MARRLRFVINGGTIDQTFGRLCWRIQLFGCLQSRGMQYNHYAMHYLVCWIVHVYMHVSGAVIDFHFVSASGSVLSLCGRVKHGYQKYHSHSMGSWQLQHCMHVCTTKPNS